MYARCLKKWSFFNLLHERASCRDEMPFCVHEMIFVKIHFRHFHVYDAIKLFILIRIIAL
jgi:hypothetical protein